MVQSGRVGYGVRRRLSVRRPSTPYPGTGRDRIIIPWAAARSLPRPRAVASCFGMVNR